MQKVALVIRGSFSPVHIGHLRHLENIRHYLAHRYDTQVQKAYISLFADSHHKDERLVQFKHRLKMCQLATENMNWVHVDTWEAEQERQPVKLLDVLEHYLQLPENNGIRVSYVSGLENMDIPEGTDNDEQMMNAMGLNGISNEDENKLEKYGVVSVDIMSSLGIGDTYECIGFNKTSRKKKEESDEENEIISVSSRLIHRYLKEGRSIRYLVPDNVLNYIESNGLFK